MEQNKEHKLSPRNEQVRQALMEHQQRKQVDPEYKELWEKRERDLQKFIFPGDNLED